MILELDGLSHHYDTERVVADVSFGVEESELVALLGPSGCGKTTLVQAIAGHVTPAGGSVRLRGTDVTDMTPEKRDVGVVFQRSTLYPHMTVRENVAYGLRANDVCRDRRADIVTEYLELVRLAGKHDSYPEELSGGQRRRVELARALAPEPDVLLLDEPLSALDQTLRRQLREEIARIQRETEVTTLFVTHDQEDAMSLADRLVLLQDGSISATGDPRRLYESPPNRFVASFLGRSNAIPAAIIERTPLTFQFGGTTVQLDRVSESASDGEVIVHVRPEDVSIGCAESSVSGVELTGVVSSVTDFGSRYDVSIQLESGERITVERQRSPPSVNEEVLIIIDPEDITVLPKSNAI